jgi:hypothetical protein
VVIARARKIRICTDETGVAMRTSSAAVQRQRSSGEIESWLAALPRRKAAAETGVEVIDILKPHIPKPDEQRP